MSFLWYVSRWWDFKNWFGTLGVVSWLERKPVADGYLGSGSSSGGNEKLGATPTNFRFFDPLERRKLSVPS